MKMGLKHCALGDYENSSLRPRKPFKTKLGYFLVSEMLLINFPMANENEIDDTGGRKDQANDCCRLGNKLKMD
jgi:hypothetical protein